MLFLFVSERHDNLGMVSKIYQDEMWVDMSRLERTEGHITYLLTVEEMTNIMHKPIQDNKDCIILSSETCFNPFELSYIHWFSTRTWIQANFNTSKSSGLYLRWSIWILGCLRILVGTTYSIGILGKRIMSCKSNPRAEIGVESAPVSRIHTGIWLTKLVFSIEIPKERVSDGTCPGTWLDLQEYHFLIGRWIESFQRIVPVFF